MDKTLHDLGRILLNAVPTLLIVSFLILYLRSTFFKPLARVLRRRHEETEGARKAAEETLQQAELRVAEYEEKLRAARGQLYTEQDTVLRQLEREQARNLEQAKRQADAQVAAAQAALQVQVNESRSTLEAQTSDLADRIVSRVLEGRAA